ncbi:MAG: hypothetical protein WCO10_02150 [bacterium]
MSVENIQSDKEAVYEKIGNYTPLMNRLQIKLSEKMYFDQSGIIRPADDSIFSNFKDLYSADFRTALRVLLEEREDVVSLLEMVAINKKDLPENEMEMIVKLLHDKILGIHDSRVQKAA